MENPEGVKMTPFNSEVTQDIRQSKEWAHCLELYGWRALYTPSGIQIASLPTPFGEIVKVQKPYPLSQNDITEIEKVCRENKALFIKIEPSNRQDISILKNAGYHTSGSALTPSCTMYIDLQKPETDLWNALSHSAKYSVRRAEREGAKMEYHRNPSPELLDKFYTVYSETAKKKNFGLRSPEDIKWRAETFGPESHLLIVNDSESKLCSAKFYLGYRGNIWYIYGGTTERGRQKNKAGYELMWQSLLYFKKLGYKVMDLDGVYDPRFPTYLNAWGGFSHFKEKFGGNLVRFPIPHTKYLHPFFRLTSKFMPVNI